MNTRKLVISALCLALSMVLPFLTGQIPTVGKLLSPMHIPVLLCGFVAGAPLGAAVGFIAPFLRFALFGMPPVFPMGTAMAFEMAVYGFAAGFLYRKLTMKSKSGRIYLSQVCAMALGRVVFGVVMYILLTTNGKPYTFEAFFTANFVKSLPGIALHLLVVPPLVLALENSGFISPAKA